MQKQNKGLAPTKNEQTMTSLEISEVTGKLHKNLMRDIRKMEKPWEKVCGFKFELTSQLVDMPNGGHREEPCYTLNKTEALFISTAFNHEARAKLVLRWASLENSRIESDTTLILDRRILELASEQLRLGAKITRNKRNLKSLKLFRQTIGNGQLRLEL